MAQPPAASSFRAPGRVQLRSRAPQSAADYQAALQQIRFNNTGTTPSTETRIIDVVVNDGTAASNTAHAIVEVTQVNNSAPVVDLDADNSTVLRTSFRATFTEGGAPIPIADTDTLITDADSTTLASATITLTDAQAGDLLAASGALPGGITASSYNSSTGVITLSGPASLADYETALEAIRFSAAGENPVAGSRIVDIVVNDGANNSQAVTALLTVVAVNDAPALVVADATYQENAAPVLLSPSASLTDVDDTELNFAAVRIAAGSFPGDGDTLTVGGATSGTVTGITFTWNPTLHALVFTGASLVANYQALLRQVQFQSSSDNPTDFAASPQRTLTWFVSDGTAVTTATTTLDIVAVNDPPINTVPGAQSVDEDTNLPIAGVSVADSDSSALTTILSVAHGILNVTTGPGAVVTGNGTAIVTIAGTAAQINTALAGLAYVGNPDFNGADTLTVTTRDGAAATDTDTIAITVNPVNDAPINTVPGAQTVAEDTILPIVGVSVADIDSSALTTTLSVLSGKLDVTAGGGAVVTNNGTASVTIAGTAAQINAALAGLAYTGNLDFNGADTLTVATSDTIATDTDTIAITVNAVDDPPALNLDADGSTIGGVDYLTTFTDGGPAVAIVDTDLLITDSDDTELTSATVTLTNPHTDDVLVFNGTPPAGITAFAYNPGTGILTLTGTASLAAYQTALHQITFDNTGTNPSTETRIIDVVVNDGTAASNLAQAIIEVTQVNNSAPTVDLDGNNSTLPGTSYHTTFTENGTPVAIADTDTLIGDPDIGSTTLASATITLTNPQIGDLLTATLPLPGGITASAYNPVTGTLTLSNVASFADYETALEAIRFSSAGDNPVAGNRIIGVVVNDGVNDSQPAISLVTVVAANDAPALVVADATYQENAAPVLLSPSASLTDADNTALNFAAVRITAGSFPGDGDTLTVNGATSGTVTGITFTWSPTLHALVLTGASSVANYQTLLQTVQFQSTSDNPTDFDASPQRTLTWFVSDGTAVATATTTLDIVAVNDPPINTVPGAQTVDEGTILPIAGVSVADIDSSALTTTLSVAHGTLNVTAGPGVTGNGTAIVTIAGTAAQINTALAGLAYADNPDFKGADTLTVATNDGTATDTDTIAITVNAHPHCDFDGDSGSDILWQGDDGTASMWLMEGPDTPFVGAVGLFNPGPTWHIQGTGDFNGDGKDDIIWQGDDGTASMWLMDGTNATFVGAVGPFNPGPTWQIKGTGDFNGDGKDDIIWQGDDGTASMWLMDGTNATFVGAVGPFNPGPTWQIKGTGDFNGDGKDDIIWQGDDGTASMWLMDGTNATFVGAVGPFNPGPSWQIKGTGDFNGDGKSDILWQGSDGTPSIWLMDGPNATFVGAVGSNPGPNWQITGTGDFNGDGKSDIVWQGSDGTPSIWLMDGTHVVWVGAVGPFNPGPTWDVIA